MPTTTAVMVDTAIPPATALAPQTQAANSGNASGNPRSTAQMWRTDRSSHHSNPYPSAAVMRCSQTRRDQSGGAGSGPLTKQRLTPSLPVAAAYTRAERNHGGPDKAELFRSGCLVGTGSRPPSDTTDHACGQASATGHFVRQMRARARRRSAGPDRWRPRRRVLEQTAVPLLRLW